MCRDQESRPVGKPPNYPILLLMFEAALAGEISYGQNMIVRE